MHYTNLKADCRDDRAVSVQQASVVHFIPFLLLRQPPHPLCKAMDIAVLLIKLQDSPLLPGSLVAQLCQLPEAL